MARLNREVRSDESPMDFHWDNHQGPVEKDSPFMSGATLGPKYNTFAGQKRPVQALESPTKRSLQAPQKSDSQIFSFSPPKTPLRYSSFTIPQRTIETDFSSGPDMSSPANADTEDTPEPQARDAVSRANGELIQFLSRNSDRKGPLGGLSSKHSGKGEIARKPYSDAISRRVEKRRRRDVDKDVRLAPRRSSNDSDSEEQPTINDNREHKAPGFQQMGLIPSVLTFIDAHPSLPNTLSFYVQFLLNCFFAFCMMYVLYGVYSTIVNDINERAIAESSEIFAEMAACVHEFKENKCDRDTRVPAMETVCNNWEKCMQRDPLKVGRTRLSAGIFAEIFNGFIEPISFKAIIVSVTVIVGCFAVNNLTFGLWRAKTHQPSVPQHAPYAHTSPQQPVNWQLPNQHYYTPYQHHGDMFGMGVGQRGYNVDNESPTKALRYR